MTRRPAQRCRTLGSILVALIFVSACQPDRSERSLPMEDGLRTVRVLYSGANEQVFGPVWDDSPKFLIFQPLVTYEVNTCSDIVGGLAARWDPSPDWKTWTIELRADVRWHDGVPVTSADVAFTVRPVGNGPYRYVRHVPKTMTELEANPDYYGEKPSIPTIVLRYGGNPITELLSGNVDIASGITPLQAVQLAADSRFRIYRTVRYDAYAVAIAWNHVNPLFRDVDVRRALTMSIDRRELHRLLNYPDDIPIFDVPVLRRHLLQGMVPDPLPFYPERAARLFTRAGWVDTDNDNILEKNGQEFRFTLSITSKESAQAVYIQDQFRRAGIRMEISTYDRSALIQKTREHDFDAAILQYNYIEQFGEFRVSGYENPELSRLRDAAWFTVDQNDHDKHMRDLWQIFGAEIPITYLHPQLVFIAAHRRVRGLQNNRSLFSIVEHLWIEDDGREPDQ